MPEVKYAPPGSVVISSTVKLDAAGLTDVGREREKNQDQFVIATLQRTLLVKGSSLARLAERWLPDSTEGTLLLVADGMGGVEGGEVASTVAVQTIVEYVCGVVPWADASLPDSHDVPAGGTLPGVKTGLHKAFQEGDAQVKRAAAQSGGADMGTTLTAAYLLWPSLYVAHVGDSRCYLLRDGALTQLTTDHTMANKLKQASDIELDASSPWHHVLWNAIGGGQHAAMEPELHRHPLAIGDVILLCSDGLNKHATDVEIAEAINASPSAEEACKRLVAMANAGGGSDNITVVVARCKLAADLVVDSEAPTMVRKL